MQVFHPSSPLVRPTLRASFLETLVVGEVHSLSDPLHSLNSACKREREHGTGGLPGLGQPKAGVPE